MFQVGATFVLFFSMFCAGDVALGKARCVAAEHPTGRRDGGAGGAGESGWAADLPRLIGCGLPLATD